jgi:UrcA family protein
MFTALLISLAMSGTGPVNEPIVVVEDRPRIVIPLAGYDLTRADGVQSLEHEIVRAARRVCDRGYRGAFHLETVACVKGAREGADAQLTSMLAQGRSTAGVTAAIAVTAPAN